MPDCERLLDDLRETIPADSARRSFERGYTAGKNYARRELLVVGVVLFGLGCLVWAVGVL